MFSAWLLLLLEWNSMTLDLMGVYWNISLQHIDTMPPYKVAIHNFLYGKNGDRFDCCYIFIHNRLYIVLANTISWLKKWILRHWNQIRKMKKNKQNWASASHHLKFDFFVRQELSFFSKKKEKRFNVNEKKNKNYVNFTPLKMSKSQKARDGE